MSIFGNILGKIFNHGGKKADAPAGQATPAPAQPAPAQPTPAPAAPAAPAPQAVDVGAVLSEMASM